MKEDAVLLANPDIVFRDEFEDFAVLFDPDSGEGYGLNQVGALIWKLLDGKNTFCEIKEKVGVGFQNVDTDVENHIDEFVQELIEKGLAGYEIPKR